MAGMAVRRAQDRRVQRAGRHGGSRRNTGRARSATPHLPPGAETGQPTDERHRQRLAYPFRQSGEDAAGTLTQPSLVVPKALCVDPSGSKAGLSLRCPSQRPKRAVGTFAQLRPDPPGQSPGPALSSGKPVQGRLAPGGSRAEPWPFASRQVTPQGRRHHAATCNRAMERNSRGAAPA